MACSNKLVAWIFAAGLVALLWFAWGFETTVVSLSKISGLTKTEVFARGKVVSVEIDHFHNAISSNDPQREWIEVSRKGPLMNKFWITIYGRPSERLHDLDRILAETDYSEEEKHAKFMHAVQLYRNKAFQELDNYIDSIQGLFWKIETTDNVDIRIQKPCSNDPTISVTQDGDDVPVGPNRLGQ